MDPVTEFKEAHKRFTKALQYIIKNTTTLKKDPARWKKINKNFKNKFEVPLDAAWAALSKSEKKRLGPIYLHYKAMQDQEVQKILKMINGRIVRVTHG